MGMRQGPWRLLVLLVVSIATCLAAAQSGPADGRPQYFSRATTFVPLESWVYPAFERLAALGFLESDITGMRPWTQRECMRLLQEAVALRGAPPGEPSEGHRIVRRLQQEFADEQVLEARRPRARVDSVYTHAAAIGGPPLEDGYHFGQTVPNDYGRSYREGFNSSTGMALRGEFGSFSAYAQAEYRYAPSADALPLSARQAIAVADSVPLPAANRFAAVSRLRLLDAYVAYSTENWMFAFGNQSLRWGHGRAGSMSFSENAEPIPMLRLARTSPGRLPLLGFLGPMRAEVFLGKLDGHNFVFVNGRLHTPPLERQPYIHGGRLGFKPTPNLEFGFGVTTIWSGPEVPLTFGNLFDSISLSNPPSPFLGLPDPGDRRSSFDFKYRLPFLRDWLTLYAESMTEDELSPIAYPRRSAIAPGLYLARVPGVPGADFRVEGFYTDLPNDPRRGVFFRNIQYRDGFRNHGGLLGHPVGRQGRGILLGSSYWQDGVQRVELTYFQNRISPGYLPEGGKQRRVGVQVQHRFHSAAARSDVRLLTGFHYERWNIPVLAAGPQNNYGFSARLAFRPRPAE
jgi:hypothetical protein